MSFVKHLPFVRNWTGHRRNYIIHLTTWLLLIVLQAGLNSAANAAAPASQPNIVFVMADDLGWRDVAFHGGNAPTPNLDRLVRESTELTAHYVAPVCSPTRTGLMTGRYWSRYGVMGPQNERALPFETVTVASALKSVGYRTCLTGKWHLGSLPEWGPNHFGFEHSYGSLAGGVTPWLHFYKKGPYTETWHRNEERIEESGHVTDLITNEAIQWLNELDGDSPFFLYVPYTAVHLPVKEPAEWVARVPESIKGDVPIHYAASIMHLDDCVGKILKTLDEKGVRDNTLFVFTSDNGGSTAENDDTKYPADDCPKGKLPGNNLPWRGKKGDLYEGGVRVPTIVSWPGHVKTGQLNDAVHITDWMPTFCELAGYEMEEDLQWDGMSLVSHLTERTPVPPRIHYAAGPSGRFRSLRDGDWKLIVQGKGEMTRVELFNLKLDPGEKENRYEMETDRSAKMLELLNEMATHDSESKVSNSGR
ncbi:MAG: sulfatase-like hydrolase/transferase [Planctomycetaceae bacterium]